MLKMRICSILPFTLVALGLIACGDDSSTNAGSDSGKDSGEVTSSESSSSLGNLGGSSSNENVPGTDISSSSSTPVCDFKLDSDIWEYEIDDPGTLTGVVTKGTVRYEFDGDLYTKTENMRITGSYAERVCKNRSELIMLNSETGEPGSNMYRKSEASCEGNELIQKTVTVESVESEGSKKDLFHGAVASCYSGM